MMTAFGFLKSFPKSWLPFNNEGRPQTMSNSTLWRLLLRGSIIINGENPKPKDKVSFPIRQLVFFPKGRRVTLVDE